MNPLFVLLLFFVGAPLAELYVLIEVGSEIGAAETILLSIFTAVLGGYLVRMQGFSILFRAQKQMANQGVPAIEMLEGGLLLVTGLTLLLPGFITDAIGFLLLIPQLRRALIVNFLQKRGVMSPASGNVDMEQNTPSGNEPHRIIDAEYRRED